MAILKLKPSFKDYLWGGRRLVTDFDKEFSGDILAESWELSCHQDGHSYIAEGPHAGKTLDQYIQESGREVLGSRGAQSEQFPVLIKFIDAAQDLSVQVHPDDAYAQAVEHQPYGKTEMWYIVDHAEGAYLYYGFTRQVTAEELAERIENNTLLEVLNKVYVKKGDVFFIEAGTIHAIGSGCLIAEIQQNSNLTYRVYDFGRRDKNGNTRPLHVEKARQVTCREPITEQKNFGSHVVSCPYFTVDKLVVDGIWSGIVEDTSFVSVLILEGQGTIQAGEEILSFRKGDSFFLTAGSGAYHVEGTCEALLTTV